MPDGAAQANVNLRHNVWHAPLTTSPSKGHHPCLQSRHLILNFDYVVLWRFSLKGHKLGTRLV